MLLAAMSQARDHRNPEQPGGAPRPQMGQNVGQILDTNLFSVNTPLGGGTTNPLLPSPASLQLAQLQAQLTLQRLKLAQTAVTSNTAAATVLNQVLSKVVMSQPLFNSLRNATMIGAHGHSGLSSLGPSMPNARFPSGGITFSTQNPTVVPKHAQNQNSVPPFGKGMGVNKSSVFYATSQSFTPDTEQSGHHGFMVGTSGSGTVSDGRYGFKHDHAPGFKKDFHDSHGQHHPMSQKGDLGQMLHNTAPNNQWESTRMWQSPIEHYEARNELYNPEEPTPDTKFSPSSPPAFSRHNNGKVGICASNLQPHELNDFQGRTPQHLPHTCTMCDKKVFNLKDWDLHVNGRMHIQNVMGYSESGIHCISNSTDGTLSSPLNANFNPPSNEGFRSDVDPTYVPDAPAAYSQCGLTFSSPPSGAKFPQRKSASSRVVHICNLPEGCCNENDVVHLGLPFGKVTNYILMKSTNQAFLEMAYTEAAEAMVQFYQDKPAMINDEKLLIRISKRYKELQLKKPGKNVDAIIHDIHSQRERDMFRDADRYRNERTRSRSPVSRSLSPRSHTPSFTSASSTHSPLGASRTEWVNGRESWDQSVYGRWEENRDTGPWRDNGEEKRDRTDHWVHDRKHYSRQLEKQELDDRIDGPRGHREKYGNLHSSSRYKSREGEYYRKEAKPKSETKLQDMPGKPKRKEEGRTREVRCSNEEGTSKKDTSEPKSNNECDSSRQKNVDKNKNSDETNEQEHDKSIKENKDIEKAEKEEQTVDHNSVSTEHADKLAESEIKTAYKHKEEEWESGSELEGETWYPTNMEELVTVDEVGEEDLIIEPDITELEEIVPVEPKDNDNCIQMCPHGMSSIDLECQCDQLARSECSSPREASIVMSCTSVRESASPASSCCDPVTDVPNLNLTAEQKCDELEENTAARSPRLNENEVLVESSESKKNPKDLKSPDCKEETAVDTDTCVDLYTRMDLQADDNVKLMDVHTQEEERHENRDRDLSGSANSISPEEKSPDILLLESKEAHSSPSWEQEDVFTELSIPLGVEFVVPRTGFYCKLCGLFYTSEDTAKTSHCRSRVHYKNLQSYLSRLAAGSSGKNEMENVLYQEDAGIVPRFEKIKP
ncbi:RNA-binding protein 20 isoform X2 [Ascaphus truei]|uniref:RNA-binding protein 20 isoform X2 n=1 Tax=Ascaphus truei TaxID=8439 RepID=UPI003F5A88B3